MSAASSYRHVQSRRSIIAGRPITTTTTMTHAYATIAFSFADAYDCKREGNELDCRRLMVVSSSWGRVGRKGGELHENRVEGLCKQHTFTHTHTHSHTRTHMTLEFVVARPEASKGQILEPRTDRPCHDRPGQRVDHHRIRVPPRPTREAARDEQELARRVHLAEHCGRHLKGTRSRVEELGPFWSCSRAVDETTCYQPDVSHHDKGGGGERHDSHVPEGQGEGGD